MGITGGVGGGRFGLDATLAYDQILTFLCRAAGESATGSDWSAAAVNWPRRTPHRRPHLHRRGQLPPLRCGLLPVEAAVQWGCDPARPALRGVPGGDRRSGPHCGGGLQRYYALKSEYPEGMRWTNDNFYRSDATSQGGYGCEGFALICSDAAFGELPVSSRHSNFDAIRVGDLLRINNDTHTVVVLEKRDNSVVVTEGNFNQLHPLEPGDQRSSWSRGTSPCAPATGGVMPPAPYIKIPWKESFQGIFICRITPGPRRVLPPRPPLKPRRVLPAAAGKMESESVFPQDICLGKNSSQPASVERTRRRCVRSARGGLPSLLAKTAGPFFANI